MGGRQPKKKEKKVNVESRPAEVENITAGIMRSHKAASSLNQQRKTGMRSLLASLIDARIDDPRVISLSPKDKSLVLGNFDVRSEPASVHKLKFSELKQSLESDGQQKPIIVTPRGKDLLVVVGNRRLDAAIKTHLDQIYALRVELTDEEAWYLSLLSNLDNRLPMVSLSEDEEAAAIDKLISEYGWTQEKAATELNRSQSWISRRIRSLKVDPDVERAVEQGELTSSHLDEIITLPKPIQSEVANAIQYYDDDGNEQLLSVAATRKMVNAVKPFVKDKTAEEIKEWTSTDDFDKVLDFEQYLEKPKRPEAKIEPIEETVETGEPVIEESVAVAESPPTPTVAESAEVKGEKAKAEEGISEQLFGKHISGEVPVASAASTVAAATPQVSVQPSTEDLETAENLDSIAAAAPEEPVAETTINCATGVKTSTVQRIVNKAGSTVLKLVCPCCDEPIILDPLKMVANWQQDLKED